MSSAELRLSSAERAPSLAPAPAPSLGGNPVLWLELVQATRLRWLPSILTCVLVLCTLAVCIVGGLLSSSVDAAELGSILFQVFFGSIFVLTSWFSPLLGAWLWVHEIRAHTRDALLLSAMDARSIVRGKLLAGLSLFGAALLLLWPLGVLSYVAGGVLAIEVVLAGVCLLVFGAVGVCVGFAFGAHATRTTSVLAFAFGTGLFASLVFFLGFGLGGAYLAHWLWPEVLRTAPVWLPLAYARASLDLPAWLTLAVAPLLLATGVATFAFESAVKGLQRPVADPNRGLKCWAVYALPAWLGLALIPRLWLAARDQYWIAFAGAMGACTVFGWCLLLVFAAEPVALGGREGRGLVSRVLQPGRNATLRFVLAWVAVALALSLGAGATQEWWSAHVLGDPVAPRLGALAFTAFGGLSLTLFGAGLVAFQHRLRRSAGQTRSGLVFALLLLALGPWLLLLALGGAHRVPFLAAVAAASPSYAAAVAQQIASGELGIAVTQWPLPGRIQLGSVAGQALFGAALWWLGTRPRLQSESNTELTP